MLKRTAILLVVAGCLSCRAHRPDLLPPSGPHFRSLSIKVHFQDGKARQNGRVLWRFDDEYAKFIFFTPLNQVGMELDVTAEEAVLVNFGKKAFWRGDFSRLLERMWGIALTHSDLKSLVAENGTMPAGFAEKGIEVTLERAAGSGALAAVRLRCDSAELALRILKDEFRPGKIVRVNYAERYQLQDLASVLEDD
jgi:hypothetical protein